MSTEKLPTSETSLLSTTATICLDDNKRENDIKNLKKEDELNLSKEEEDILHAAILKFNDLDNDIETSNMSTEYLACTEGFISDDEDDEIGFYNDEDEVEFVEITS